METNHCYLYGKLEAHLFQSLYLHLYHQELCNAFAKQERVKLRTSLHPFFMTCANPFSSVAQYNDDNDNNGDLFYSSLFILQTEDYLTLQEQSPSCPQHLQKHTIGHL